MRSILDGLEGVFSIPIETHFFQNMHYWVDNEYRRERPQKLTKNDLLDRFCKFIHSYNIAEDKLSDTVIKGGFNEEKFCEFFSKIDDTKIDKEILELYYSAIYYSLTNQYLSDELRIVEKSVENAEFAVELSKFYPKAKFIHILRNPYSNFVSLRKYKSVKFGFPLIYRLINTLSNNYYYLYKNQRIIDHYKIVRYEDLVRQPEKTIREIANYLDIPFTEKMLFPTSMGNKWTGNSTTGEQYNKINNKNLDKWKEDISPLEIKYINELFSFVLADYKYDIFHAKGTFWKPVKGENIPRYLVNRLYKIYLRSYK
jgi:hypothetical protein